MTLPKKVYKLKEAADILNVSRDTIRRWDKSGKLKSLRTPSGHRRFTKEAIEEVIGTAYEPIHLYNNSTFPPIPPQVRVRIIQESLTTSFPLQLRLISFLLAGAILSFAALKPSLAISGIKAVLQPPTPKELASTPLSNEAVLGVETQGGSAVTLASILDSNFNLSISGYVEALTLKSTATSGSPITVQSTAKVANLNSDLLDGYDWSSDLTFSGTPSFASNVKMTGSGKQFLFSSSSSDPTALGAGSAYYNTSSSVLKYYNGSTWISLSSAVTGDQYLRSDIADTAEGKITFNAGALIHSGSPGSVSADSTGDDLVLEGSSSTGINILVPDVYQAALYLGTASDNNFVSLISNYAQTYGALTSARNIRFEAGSGYSIAVNDNGADVDFRVESDGNANMLTVDAGLNKVGIGAAPTDGTLHVQTASAGTVSANSNADDLVVEGSGTTGISILTPDASFGYIEFGSPTDNDYTQLYTRYNSGLYLNHNSNSILEVNDSTGRIYFNPGQADLDFSVSGVGNADLVFTDAGNDRVGIGGVPTDGLVHIQSGSAGSVTAETLADELVIENSSNAGISILSPDDYLSAIVFGHASNSLLAEISTNYTPVNALRLQSWANMELNLAGASGEVVVNNDGGDYDFRIESDGASYMFFVDGGNNKVDIGTQTQGAIASFSTTGIIFNEDSQDRDFRIESDNDANIIFVDAGNNYVGIGTNAPAAKLHVKTSASILSGKSALVVDQLESEDILTASASGTTKLVVDNSGAIYAGDMTTGSTSTAVCWETATKNGATVYKLTDCLGTPADLAEWYPVSATDSLEPGEVIAIGDPIGSGSAQAFLVKKSDAPYDSQLIGVVSTKAFQVMGEEVLNWAEKAVQVALVGRVLVKIDPASSPISPGDFVTSSSQPGMAMKAENDGYIVGKALESWSPDSPTDSILVYLNQSVNIGKILTQQDSEATSTASSALSSTVSDLDARLTLLESKTTLASSSGTNNFDNLTLSDLTVLGSSVLSDTLINGKLTMGLITIDSADNSISAAGALKIQPAALSSIELVGSTVVIEPGGNLAVNTGVIKANDKLRGSAPLAAGQFSVRVDKAWEGTPSSITVTPSFNTAVWVTDKSETGFTINVASAPTTDETVDWLAIW